ncbi:60 kDa polyprotein, partial [Elysia marginata]
MASKKKLQKYCRIHQWIVAKDEALAGAIRDLCMEGALSGGRRSGATFIYPPSSVSKEIVKKAYSADAEEAIFLLNAHIIPDSVRTAADFKRGVGSRLGIKLEVESASGSSVTLKGGAKLKVADDFHPLRKENIAVWEVESGEVPLEGPKFEAPKRGRGECRGEYRGGFGASGATLNARQLLASGVEHNYDECMRANRCRTKDPYLAHAVSLLNFLKQNHPSLF